MRETRFCFLATALFTGLLVSCERVETNPPNFPKDLFLDTTTYQGILDLAAPDEWSVVAFDRTDGNAQSSQESGIVFALSRHGSKDEFLFLYHFLGGRKDAGFSVKGAEGDPQPVSLDAQTPLRVEWKSRALSLEDLKGTWRVHSEEVGSRYPIYGTLEDITVHGRFGGYNVQIHFDRENESWEFDVSELE